jgi:hypothetical protein
MLGNAARVAASPGDQLEVFQNRPRQTPSCGAMMTSLWRATQIGVALQDGKRRLMASTMLEGCDTIARELRSRCPRP